MLDVLTADHGHDLSPPHRSHSPLGTGSFLTQMPLSILGSVLRKQTSSSGLENHPTTKPTASGTSTPLHFDSDTPGPSPALSRAASLSSTTTAEGKPKKKSPRPKTTYNLAVPPPIAGPRHKLHLRPKVLLQLHQVVPGRRPKPVYEVIPFSLLAPRSTRRLARTFKGKDKLCPNNLLVVKTEGYDNSHEEAKTDDERWGTRDVLGIICPPKKSDRDPHGKPEVLLDDGTNWDITRMPNGGYEFSYVDEHGLTLKRRWVPKGPNPRRVSSMSTSSQVPGSPGLSPGDRKFNFSTINPTSRRHPVIASMTRASIEVCDEYNMPSATSPPTPGLQQSFTAPLPTPVSISDEVSFLDAANEHLPVRTDDALRAFIILTGIWVAFSEKWSATESSAKQFSSPHRLDTSLGRPCMSRAVSMSFIDTPRSASPASTSDENSRSAPKISRSNTSASPITTRTNPPTPTRTRSRRSNSTGNAELISKNGISRKRFGLAFEDETLAETEEERQEKRSSELLRMKELALSDPSPADNTDTGEPSPSANDRARKTQSAYNPLTTAGLWDSGVVDGPGRKSRPTSMVILNQKKGKAKRKQERDKSKEKKGGGLRQRFLGLFRKEKN
ncbi:hypothetical protein M011DRAFT_465847 [Sporormia fimetaria CBS 119925]|uniref:Uncharacterized protein n=1 Tax=Sporormia fimetaria CBS 119925 TaxID=1340428 RepID=A0A6A6VFN9_9PLEO|nr:hypothetical protein M011DRAFT_465847 [Sporormia fimetaria CBS 119925]